MRTRTYGPTYKVMPEGQSYYNTQAAPGVPYPAGFDKPFSALTRVETMTDEVKPLPPCGFKPCEHILLKGNWVEKDYINTVHHYPGGNDEYPTQKISWAALMANSPLGPYLEGLYSGLEGTAKLSHSDRWQLSSVWERSKPKIEPTMDLVVFLAELKDFSKLAKSFASKYRAIENLGGAAKAALADFEMKNVGKPLDIVIEAGGGLSNIGRKTVSGASNQWLEYNFAIQQMLRDMAGFVKGFLSWKAQLQNLMNGADVPQKSHFSFTTTEEQDPIPILSVPCTWCETYSSGPCAYDEHRLFGYWNDHQVPGEHYFDASPGGVTTRIGLTVYYKYTLPPWAGDMMSWFNAFTAALGFNPGVGTIWELLPFSFVLDWFWPIGQIFDRANLQAFPVKTEILDICWTKKQSRKVLLTGRPFMCPLSETDGTFFQGEIESFSRIVGTEPFTWIPAFRWPNWMQLSLGAALLGK